MARRPRAWWTIPSAWRATRRTIRAGLLAGPVLHPWYLGWTLMFEPLAPSAAWLLFSFTAVLNYGVLATPAEGGSFHLPLVWRWVEQGLPLLLALLLWMGGRRGAEPGREGVPDVS